MLASKKGVRNAVASLDVWNRDDQIAVHKPLLLLVAIARVIREEEQLLAYRDARDALQPLLEKYAPHRDRQEPYYGFWHLQEDELWQVVGRSRLKMREGKNRPPESELNEKNPAGRLPQKVHRLFQEDSKFTSEIIQMILDRYFPAYHRAAILSDLGLRIAPATTGS